MASELACGDSSDSRPTGPGSGDGGTAQVVFADTALGAAVREALGASGTLRAGMLDSLTTLTASRRGIESLEGIEQLHGLQVLDLADNVIVQIGPLARLDSLSFLDLTGNQVSDLSPLAGLRRLTTLLLAGNLVTDISLLLDLEHLATLELTGNPLPDETRQAHLAVLSARGVDVSFDADADSVDPGPIGGPNFEQFSYAFNGKARIGRRFNIWIGTTDISPPWPLIDESADFIDFDWSPDGSRMVFRSNREDASRQWYRTYLVNADGSGLEAISDFAQHDQDFTWSPDGTRIAYVAKATVHHIGGDIQVMNADGSGVREVTDPDGEDGAPAWSPNGERLAFIRDPGGEVIVLDVDTRSERKLTEDAVHFLGLEWSPSGDALLYTGDARDGTTDLEVMVVAVDDGQVTNLTSDPSWDRRPRWSPDGTQIVFTSNRDMPHQSWGGDVFIMDADGSKVTKLTPSDGLCHAPSWSPDGSLIAYSSDRSGIRSIHLVDPTGVYDLNRTAGEPPIQGAPSAEVKWQRR